MHGGLLYYRHRIIAALMKIRKKPKLAIKHKKTVTGAEPMTASRSEEHFCLVIAVERSNKHGVLHFQEMNSLFLLLCHYTAHKFSKNTNI